ncbi:MAG: hypothetical protein GWN61_05530 [candidate division Zixibacteria bacterium]|nr:hypothetical protein [Phycisphaerae bacterium]NIR67247.1 hypothetical protein [candidate division Zixibacteria bacterium]NIW45773.1 hypothetical protein [Gammaproteobacteria bacterium]NIS45480.1 hypothetical protein [candidate division Zixibacteria bacterium]NIU16694.1 hypothetical protein [candidate division Zixibacteria bacterium]
MSTKQERAEARIARSKERKAQRFEDFINRAMTRKYQNNYRRHFCCIPAMPVDVIDEIVGRSRRFANTVVIIEADILSEISEEWGWSCGAREKVHILTDEDIEDWKRVSQEIIDSL